MWVQEILPSRCLTDGPSVCVCMCLSSSAKAQPLSRLRRMCLCLLSIEGGQVIYLPNEERYKKRQLRDQYKDGEVCGRGIKKKDLSIDKIKRDI